jgi:hypothetical protein
LFSSYRRSSSETSWMGSCGPPPTCDRTLPQNWPTLFTKSTEEEMHAARDWSARELPEDSLKRGRRKSSFRR